LGLLFRILNNELVTKKKVLGFKVPPRLEQVGANIPSACKTANIAQNDAMILPHDANPGRMEFSEKDTLGLTVSESFLQRADEVID
jgi:hypothetical protein